jgi:hypothetical protein
MNWVITFPVVEATRPVIVIDGMFVASGTGPPGQVRRLFAELSKIVAGQPVRVQTGNTVRSDELASPPERRWTVLFDLGTATIDPTAAYRLDLYVATGNGGHQHKARLDNIRFVSRSYKDHEVQAQANASKGRGPNVIYPSAGAVLNASGVSCYGMVTTAGETVPTNGGKVFTNLMAPDATSVSGGNQPNGFWWLSFNAIATTQPTPNAKTLRIVSSVPLTQDVAIQIQ